MLKFHFPDGSTLVVDGAAQVMTNNAGKVAASAVEVGQYIMCGQTMFCQVTLIESV